MQTQVNIRHNIQKTHISSAYLRSIHGNTGTLISDTTNDDGSIGHNSKNTLTVNTSNTYHISAGAYSDKIGADTLTATGNSTNITSNPADDYIYDGNGNMTQNNNKLIQ
ncbi:hypothetical protein [Bathymodiolus thermophilus thioautotrophic gill symbiont]|uniref:hypothetical protein n=1 Tax=Bathymodiolus thermophilus thioautotrophic gill symbiont TaxID=2360 RepID=UPI0011608BA5|nr:hypothetical protein [Bathymodiolus thermophilus thioautotrophic gill symbiont]